MSAPQPTAGVAAGTALASAATAAAPTAAARAPAAPSSSGGNSSGDGGGSSRDGGNVDGSGDADAAAPSPSTGAADPSLPPPPRWVTHKRQFRTRAHSNPLSDGNFAPPACAAEARLEELIPLLATAGGAGGGERHPEGGAPAMNSNEGGGAGRPRHVEWLDIGCGFGGLLMALAPRHPTTPMLGMEIRERVTEFCAARLAEARAKAAQPVVSPGTVAPPSRAYTNVGFVRTNAMKYLPNYIPRGTLTKLFFCYPDPHFKRKKHRQRIISSALLAEYAFVLAPGGVAYAVTDVYTLSVWMFTRFDAHPLFVRLSDAELATDPMVAFVRDHTDEAQRVERNGGAKFVGAWRRVPHPVDHADDDSGAVGAASGNGS